MTKPKLLLHICCAPCSTTVIEQLKKEFELTLFFYNPNIHPQFEKDKRLEECEKLSKHHKIQLIVGDYDYKNWFNFIKGLEQELEGGKRCEKCFEFRLNLAAKTAKELSFDSFTTSLTVSPHKNSKTIHKIGKNSSKKYEIDFFEGDFKKNEGYKKSIELSKELNLYRQKFCGCIFSFEEHIEKSFDHE
ncbi:epoxyqueuosine reductase QueH [Candidatus Woesearchaeota archaeon]|jgi:predicted adenine nucleotide alpha hydrolase (AANH) superfamily ATPase|nr:epoxyqueuosine reductase QueH [Candidatus Woesearchaeota archaeon]